MKLAMWVDLHSRHWKSLIFCSTRGDWTSGAVSFEMVFLMVRSGEHVRLHEGGLSAVPCIMTGGFELLSEEGGKLSLLAGLVE